MGNVFGNGGTISSRCKETDLLIFYNERTVKFHKVTLDLPGLRIYVPALESRHLISIVSDLIDSMSFTSLDIDILVAYKYFFSLHLDKMWSDSQCTLRK